MTAGRASRYGMGTEEFSALMQDRLVEILLVASHYDAFVLEEDGQLAELVFREYRNLDLNLRFAPRFTRTADAREALELTREREFDMVISTPRVLEMDITEFVGRLREQQPELPIGMLAAHAWDLPWLEELRHSGKLDLMFLWQGNVQALLAMIKQMEDRRNADHDLLEGGVQAIIVVEDDVRFYSTFLAHIYTEVTTQTGRLMAEGVNLSHRLLRIRARPKILLAQSYEDAWALFERYQKNLLGVITDITFPRDGVVEQDAGLQLARAIRTRSADLPVLLVSMEDDVATAAAEVGAAFQSKASATLLEDLRRFILEHFGFGDFVFRYPNGEPIARAHDLRGLLRRLGEVPVESLVHHAGRNHFSAWLKARTEFELAALLRPRAVSDFPSGDELRRYLVDTFTRYLQRRQRHVITDFDGGRFDQFVAFSRMGSGSLGGKGRGLAYLHKLLAQEDIDVEGVNIAIPQTMVLASDVFEEFIERNTLPRSYGEDEAITDEAILNRFRAGRIAGAVRRDLARFLHVVRDPLAIRSSSILEDSVYQPFAGVYATIMLPNNHPSLDVRLAQLLEAIKVVYGSTYFAESRSYLASTPYRIEEELMAVLVQRLVGSAHGDRFYPTFAGVASSYNFYTFRAMRPEDGVAQLALGLGKSVVDGFGALRMCPHHPQVLPQFSAIEDILRNAQRTFYALDLSRSDVIPSFPYDANLERLDVAEATNDAAAAPVFSTYQPADDVIRPGLRDGGAPIVTFASLLKGQTMPLPEVLVRLLDACQRGLASPIELEFAADLKVGVGRRQTFHALQLRPLVIEQHQVEVEVGPEAFEASIVRSDRTLGSGRSEDVPCAIVVDPRKLDRSHTKRAARVIEQYNHRLNQEQLQAVLLGPGRWGSRDPWLGIPVVWSQISAARAIVEVDFPELQVEPSLGSHFFHNLTCFRVAFLAVHSGTHQGFVDWDWFARQPAVDEAMDGAVRLLQLERPLRVLVEGASGRGVIVDPSEAS